MQDRANYQIRALMAQHVDELLQAEPLKLAASNLAESYRAHRRVALPRKWTKRPTIREAEVCVVSLTKAHPPTSSWDLFPESSFN